MSACKLCSNTNPAQALESLSSPEPSTQLPRLKGLYADLHDALAPLFPPAHAVLQTLSSPLPPTSSPLHSTLALLKEILAALRQRCAPARDPDIDALRASLDAPLHQHPALAALIVTTFKALIALADTLKADLTQSVLGAMSEAQLAAVVAQQARAREREIVLDLWGGEENLRAAYHAWVRGQEEGTAAEKKKHLARTLVDALGSATAVSCDVPATGPSHPPPPASTPTPAPHLLPPHFFFTAPALLYLQNYLQALVIAASLRALTRLPPAAPSDFTARVWALLKAEIDRDEYAVGVPGPGLHAEGEQDATRLLNLADEVVRARRLGLGGGGADGAQGEGKGEEELRAAVERTLKPRDPVFLLLLGRLVKAVGDRLQEVLSAAAGGGETSHGVPQRMQTGRNVKGVANGSVSRATPERAIGAPVVVKGFEDPVLVGGVEDAVRKILQCVEWVDGVWGDLI